MINRGAVEAWWWHQSSIPRSQIHVGRVLILLATKTAETVVFHASTSIFTLARKQAGNVIGLVSVYQRVR